MLPSPTEIYGNPDCRGPLVLTCEHATRLVHPPLAPTADDLPWLETHWGWDIGAAEVTREMVRCTDSVAVLSCFSRLVCDPNRDPEDPTWIRTAVEGYPLSFNEDLDDTERERRRRLYHDPFHAAVDAMLRHRLSATRDLWLVSIHSFTPDYMGQLRTMDLGVLYDDFEPHARHLAALLAADGFVTALNEPYSGFDHLMYSANRHGRAHGLHYLELEVRQDLIATDALARGVGRRIADALTRFLQDLAEGL